MMLIIKNHLILQNDNLLYEKLGFNPIINKKINVEKFKEEILKPEFDFKKYTE